MKKISKQAFGQLTEGCEIIEADWFGPKVLLLQDGTYLKLFRHKRLFSKNRIFPYAKRFARNVAQLQELQIPTVNIIDYFNLPFIKKAAVHYSPLEGETLRSGKILFDASLCRKLGEFISSLHEKGVYFRSLHLGNIVLTPEDKLGLIDIADMAFYSKPLSARKRRRNFSHLLRYSHDTAKLTQNLNALEAGYNTGSPNGIAIQEIFRHQN